MEISFGRRLSKIQNPKSTIQNPQSTIHNPRDCNQQEMQFFLSAQRQLILAKLLLKTTVVIKCNYLFKDYNSGAVNHHSTFNHCIITSTGIDSKQSLLLSSCCTEHFLDPFQLHGWIEERQMDKKTWNLEEIERNQFSDNGWMSLYWNKEKENTAYFLRAANRSISISNWLELSSIESRPTCNPHIHTN